MYTGKGNSGRVKYSTPAELFRRLDARYKFTLDPCCEHHTALCAVHFTEEDNGLIQPWAPHSVYMNPPYGRTIGLWMAKAVKEWRTGASVVALVPASTDTAWWHDYAALGRYEFIRGRVKFVGEKSCAPFPSALIVYDQPNSDLIC
jgi:phage N-6-adenine-methyltransferase